MLIAEGFELFAISLCFESWGRNHNLPLAGKAHEKTLCNVPQVIHKTVDAFASAVFLVVSSQGQVASSK